MNFGLFFKDCFSATLQYPDFKDAVVDHDDYIEDGMLYLAAI